MNSHHAHPIISCIAAITLGLWTGVTVAQNEKPTYEEYLRKSAVPKEALDIFLDPSKRSWAQFDSELGYILGRYMPRDGIDGSSTISTVQKNGASVRHVSTQIDLVALTRMETVSPCAIRSVTVRLGRSTWPLISANRSGISAWAVMASTRPIGGCSEKSKPITRPII